MAKLLPIILLLLGIGGGIGAGIMLAPEPEPTAEHSVAEHEETVEEEEAEPEEGEEATPNDFVKINNQFVVPVVERDEMTSLVVVSLSLETKPGMSAKVHAFEPKLRDGFLRVLFDHANMGGFKGAFTRSELLDPLRNALKEEAQRYLGKDLIDVLILDITRQDV